MRGVVMGGVVMGGVVVGDVFVGVFANKHWDMGMVDDVVTDRSHERSSQ